VALLLLADWPQWPTQKILPPKSAILWLTIHGQPPVLIPLLDPAAAHQYLRVYLTTDGNYRTELSTFQRCNNQYVQLMQTCPFSTCKAFVAYWQCYLPTIGYPLPLHWCHLTNYTNYKPATSIFLNKLWYPCTFPHAIAYASMVQGGIGFLHLSHKQGLQKCLQLLKNLRTNTSISAVYKIVLQHNQLLFGLPTSILEDTWPLLWSNAPWTDTIHPFLHTIHTRSFCPSHGFLLRGINMAAF